MGSEHMKLTWSVSGNEAQCLYHGQKLDRSGDWINGGLYVLRQTFDCAHDPKYEESLHGHVSPDG